MNSGDNPSTNRNREQNRSSGNAASDEARPKAARLNAKHQRFVEEYLMDLNGTQAYLRAYPGVKETTARSNAAKLLANANIEAAIAEKRAETAQRLEITRDMVIEQYARLGFSDTRNLYDAYGQIKPVHELDDDTAAAVQSIEVEHRLIDGADSPPVPVLKIRMADRKGALDSLMRAQGWNMPDKMEHTGKDGGAIEHQVRVVMVPPKQKAETTVKRIERTDEV